MNSDDFQGSRRWRWMLLLLCLVGWLPARAGAANVDSLMRVVEEMPNDTASVIAMVKITNRLRNEGHLEAEQVAQKALDMASRLGQPRYLGEAHICMGLVHSFRNNYDRALGYFQDAERFFMVAGYDYGVAKTNLNMAASYLARLNYDVAKKHLLTCKDLVERKQLTTLKVPVNTNLAIIYTEEKRYEEAINLHKESLDLLAKANDPLQESVCYTNIGFIYDALKRPAEAYPYYEKAYAKAQAAGGRYYEGGFALLNMINALVLTDRVAEASTKLKDLWPLADSSDSPLLVAETHRAAARIRARTGDYRSAYDHLEQFIVLNDSLKNEDLNDKIAAKEKEYEMLKRDLTISKIEEESKQMKEAADEHHRNMQRQASFLVGLGVLGALLLAALVIMTIALVSRGKMTRKLRDSYDLIRSQHKAIEEQNQALRSQNEHLEDLNREKDGLVGIVAHDLKAPLNKALALSELLSLQGTLNEDQTRSVQMMGKVASAGNDLIRDLLDLNAIEHPDNELHPETVDLGSLLHELEVGFGGEAQRKSIQMRYVMSQQLAPITCDRKALMRIMDNLVSNALKFSPKGKEITVRVSGEANTVVLAVSDQGPGISAEDREKMFKKFQRLSARPTGGESSTGLGLAITQALVHKLGGSIRIESVLGNGATFFVILPR